MWIAAVWKVMLCRMALWRGMERNLEVVWIRNLGSCSCSNIEAHRVWQDVVWFGLSACFGGVVLSAFCWFICKAG